MHVSCSICRDIFSPESKVCITECGHLYHVNCLNKWGEESTTCPQCRSHVRQRTQEVEFLFREIPDDKSDESFSAQLVHDYEVVREEEKELRVKYEKLISTQSQLRQKISACKSEIKNSEFDIVIWETQCGVYEQVEDTREKLLKENEVMKEKNDLLNKLDKLIHGTENEMNEVLAGMPINSSTLKQLCSFVQAMKYKLQKREDYYKNKKKKIIELTEECINDKSKQRTEVDEPKKGKTYADKAVQADPKTIKKFRRKLLKKAILGSDVLHTMGQTPGQDITLKKRKLSLMYDCNSDIFE